MSTRPFLYNPRVTIALCVVGLLCAAVMRNGLAIVGWSAAICGALWATSERDVGRGS